MINSFKIFNNVTLNEVELSRNSGNYILDNVDWDVPTITPYTYRVPKQVGETLKGVVIGTRSPVITGYIVADTSKFEAGLTLDKYYKKQLEDIEEKKEYLNKLISVHQKCTIIIGEYYLDVIPSNNVLYSTDEVDNNEVLCKFSIEFCCYENPMFYKGGNTVVTLASVEELFHFPMIIPKTSGVVFGNIMKRQSVLIENKGSEDSGCIITITADGGSVANPVIYNVTTQEKMLFNNLVLSDGDKLVIDTSVGNESVILHKVETASDINAIGYMSMDSTFFKIKVGSNYYSYSVLDEYKNNINVTIEFSERYINLRGM